jgi:hypothetical protein
MLPKAFDLISLFASDAEFPTTLSAVVSCIVPLIGAFGGNFCMFFMFEGMLPLSLGEVPIMSETSFTLLLVIGLLLNLAAFPSISPSATICLLL